MKASKSNETVFLPIFISFVYSTSPFFFVKISLPETKLLSISFKLKLIFTFDLEVLNSSL